MANNIVPYNFMSIVDKPLKYVVYGDTDSMYINIPELKPKTAEEAVQHATVISKEINDIITHYLNSFLLPKMGVDPINNKTEFKTEFVCDALLLLEQKKSYAYHVLAREGKIIKPVVKYAQIGLKSSNSKWTKDFLHTMIEEYVLNPNIKPQELKEQINKLAGKMYDRINEDVRNYDFYYIGLPKKWGTNYKNDEDPFQVTAMKLYNTIMNDKVFTPMSSCYYLPITIDNPINFETKISPLRGLHDVYIGNLPITQLTMLAFPYNYNKEKLKTAMEYYGLKINVTKTWDTLYDKVINTIVKIAHAYSQNSLMYGGK